MAKEWVYGSRLYRGRPIEVLHVHFVRRGAEPIPLGWKARINIGNVEIITIDTHRTQEEAERALCAASDALVAA